MMLLLITSIVLVWLLHDRIVDRFIKKVNTYLVAEVKVDDVDVTWLRHFPRVTVSLKNVRVEDSHSDAFTLLSAQQVGFSFNALDVWNGRYEILGMEVIGSRLHIRYNDQGIPNFSIWKSDSSSTEDALKFNLRDVVLSNALVSYADSRTGDQHRIRSQKTKVWFDYTDGQYDIRTSGDVLVDQVRLNDMNFLRGRQFQFDLVMRGDPELKSVEFTRTDLRQGDASYKLSGYFDYGEHQRLDLALEANETTFQAIGSFLPEQVVSALSPYAIDGKLHFSLKLSGNARDTISLEKGLALTASFGCTDTRFTHPGYGMTLEHANFSGLFTLIGTDGAGGTELRIDSLNATMEGKPVSGRLHVRDFNDPLVDLALRGTWNAAAISAVLSDSTISDVGGAIEADVRLRGKIRDLRQRSTASRVESEGTIRFLDFSVSSPQRRLILSGWNGRLTLEGNDVEASELQGNIGVSDVWLDGRLVNAVAWLLQDNQDLGIELKIKSRNMDVDEWMTMAFGSDPSLAPEGAVYNFWINPRFHFRFDYEIGALKYDRFRARRWTGSLQADQGLLRLKGNRFRSLGGEIVANGTVDTSVPGTVRLKTDLELSKVLLDSAFHVFYDFGQDFIQQRHLKGKTTATLRVDAEFDSALQLRPDKLVADLDILIRDGELNDFEPMMGLSKYLDDNGLKHLRFADLKNEIHIRDQTVFIPRMEIRSNLTNIELAGKHTFDQRIDYRLVVPWSNRRKGSEEEAGDALQTDRTGKSKLYLKITGTTDQYDIAYDAAAVKEKIGNEIRKEVRSFKESFRTREIKDSKKQPRLSEEEFDWEN